jgi:hypothetical protein
LLLKNLEGVNTMRTKTTTVSLLLAGLLGAAGAWAETPPNATSDTAVGGQASTMTQGRPNMATTNEPALATPAPAPTGTIGTSSPMASDASSTGAMGAAPALSNDSTSYGTSNSAVVENPSTTTTTMGASPDTGRYTYGTSGAQTMDVPVRGGEVSTMTDGRPNASTNNYTPDGAVVPAPRVAAAPDVRLGTGEASTMVNGQPNANPDDPVINKTRAERRSEREFKHADASTRREQAAMGQRGAAEPWQQPGGTPE